LNNSITHIIPLTHHLIQAFCAACSQAEVPSRRAKLGSHAAFGEKPVAVKASEYRVDGAFCEVEIGVIPQFFDDLVSIRFTISQH